MNPANEKKPDSRFESDNPVPTYFRLSLPVVFGSIITIVYNLADTYFIARTGDELLVAGVSVCAPVFMILMAFGNIFGQGGSSLLSRLLYSSSSSLEPSSWSIHGTSPKRCTLSK